MHYEVEVSTNAGGWLRKREKHKLLAAAESAAGVIRDNGGAPRIVRVASDGTRTVVG